MNPIGTWLGLVALFKWLSKLDERTAKRRAEFRAFMKKALGREMD